MQNGQKNDASVSNRYNQDLDVLKMNVKPVYTDKNQDVFDYAIGEREIVDR